jgi:pimeloyl-ACP methyl ester carboxylesterase
MTCIFLPATSPSDPTYGQAPDRLTGTSSFRVRFERQVWYNAEHRRAAIAQITRENPPRPWVLVGFSKSGLGAINLAIEHTSLFAAVIVFDAPLAMRGSPPWDSGAFYGQPEWEADLPINRLPEIRQMLRLTRLRHVAGASFCDHHERFHTELAERSPAYEFVSQPGLAHHWASGWVEQFCERLVAPGR